MYLYVMMPTVVRGTLIANNIKLPVPKSTRLKHFFTKNVPPDDEHCWTDFVFTYTVKHISQLKESHSIRAYIPLYVNIYKMAYRRYLNPWNLFKIIIRNALNSFFMIYLSHNYSSSSFSLFIFLIQTKFLVITVFENGATVYDFVDSCTVYL